MSRQTTFVIGGERIRLGETRDMRLKVSENYTGDPIAIPVRVIRAKKKGPSVFITGAVHGDEINGTGIIRQIMFGDPVELRAGSLVLAPVVNTLGFESTSRYLPDRRDLNRSFPGSPNGSLASRLADVVFRTIVQPCDFGIDLHSAAVRRVNYPNIRGDMTIPGVRRLARAFGCELLVNGRGPIGSLRREACRVGCPTIILEAGEVWKIEPHVVEIGVRGVRNVLMELGMLDGEPARPAFQTRVDKTMWVRAELGGILTFHVAPGDLVESGQPLATNVSVIGEAQSIVIAPADGIVLGMTTLPAVMPGEPVCHIAIPAKRLRAIRRSLAAMPDDHPDRKLREEFASDIAVYPPGVYESEWPETDQ